jgi:hypothetical protein
MIFSQRMSEIPMSTQYIINGLHHNELFKVIKAYRKDIIREKLVLKIDRYINDVCISQFLG